MTYTVRNQFSNLRSDIDTQKSTLRTEIANLITVYYQQKGFTRDSIAEKMFISDGSNFRKLSRNIKDMSFPLRFIVAAELSAEASAHLMCMGVNLIYGNYTSESERNSWMTYAELIGAGDVSIAEKNRILLKHGIDAVKA